MIEIFRLFRNSEPSDAGMSWLEFIAAMTGTLAWPIALAFVAFIYRKQLNALLLRLKSASGFGASAEFEARLDSAEITADTLEDGGIITAPKERDVATVDYNAIASISPHAAIMSKWAEVESTIIRLVEPSGDGSLGRRVIARPMELMSLGLLDYESAKLLNDLRSLRNEAAHARPNDISITEQQAKRFIELADQLLNSMIAKRKEASKGR